MSSDDDLENPYHKILFTGCATTMYFYRMWYIPPFSSSQPIELLPLYKIRFKMILYKAHLVRLKLRKCISFPTTMRNLTISFDQLWSNISESDIFVIKCEIVFTRALAILEDGRAPFCEIALRKDRSWILSDYRSEEK